MVKAPSSHNVQAAARATRWFFLLSGVGVAAWAPMVPFAKARLALDEAELGLLLLCMGLGSVGAMPLAGFLSHRHGNRRVMVISGTVIALALPLLVLAPSTLLLGATLAVFGAAIGAIDVSMNAHAVDVERLHGRPLMSGFHALYSIGGIAGAAAMSALLAASAPLIACAIAVSLFLLANVATQWRHLLVVAHAPEIARRSVFSLPSPTVVLLGVLALIMFLSEGAMLDWTAVFLRSERGFAIASAGIGYAAFSVAMSIGRLTGDRVTAALGPVRVARYGAVVAAAGFLLAAALPWGATSLAGFVLVGLGASNIVPVLFSAAGRVPGTSASIALATVTGLGYAGVLMGPAAIGFVAHATSLPIALGLLAVLVAGVAAGASILRAPRTSSATGETVGETMGETVGETVGDRSIEPGALH